MSVDRPPGSWSDLATKDDLDRRFDEIDRRFDALEAGIDLRVTSAVNRAIAGQTRWVFGAIIAVIPILAVINRL